MTTNVVIPANLQWVGLAKETTYGTPVAAPTAWIPIDGSSLKWKPNQTVLTDQAYRGLMGTDFEQVPGMRHDTLAYKTYAYLDNTYQHLLALFGRPDAITGTAAPYTHKTALENGVDQAQAQPMSFTLFYFDGAKCFQIPGCLALDVKLDVKVDTLDTLDVQWVGLPASVMGSAPSNTPDTNTPFPAWNSTVSVAGSAVSNYSEVSIEYKRDTVDVPTINASQSPLEIFGGGVSVSGTLTAIYQGASTDANLNDYLANTQPSLSVKMAPVGDAVHSLTVQHSVVAFDGADVSGNKWMEVQAQFKALMNATDALDSKQSPGQVILVNTAATAY